MLTFLNKPHPKPPLLSGDKNEEKGLFQVGVSREGMFLSAHRQEMYQIQNRGVLVAGHAASRCKAGADESRQCFAIVFLVASPLTHKDTTCRPTLILKFNLP